VVPRLPYKLISAYARNLLLEFGEKVLGMKEEWLRASRAFAEFRTQEGAPQLLQARVLAYASSTWIRHRSSIKPFTVFCAARDLSIFSCTPYIVNLFILNQTQDGVSYGKVQSFLDSLAFILKFFGVPNFADDPMVTTVKKFAEKTCEHLRNAKLPFGSAEVRAIWDSIDVKFGCFENMPKKELRSFMLAVFQHQTFCRFSDAEKIQLSDVFHDVDYFKITIRYSKTDQQGEDQFVYLPKSSSPYRNAHMLMCLYIEKMGFEGLASSTDLYLFPPLK